MRGGATQAMSGYIIEERQRGRCQRDDRMNSLGGMNSVPEQIPVRHLAFKRRSVWHYAGFINDVEIEKRRVRNYGLE